MHIKFLGTVIISVVAMNAMADGAAYWVGTDGKYVRSGFGECVRTIDWTPAKAVAGCDGDAMQSKAAVVSNSAKANNKAKAKKTTKVSAKPVAAPMPVAKTEPRYRNLSLASGATFELGGSTLSASGKSAVAALLAEFKGENIKSVIVEGHTDDRGAAAFNQQLSEKRAQAVKAELIANGVPAEVIKTVGYGESSPIASNDSRDGRAKNRRVEIKVDAKTRQL